MGGCSPKVNLQNVLIAHGSTLILPLAVIEGPIIAIIAGFLSAQGFIAWYWAIGLLLCGDLIGDVMYYWAGRTGAAPLAFLGRRLGMRTPSQEVQRGLAENSTRMLLVGKWTHAVGVVVLVGSGMLRVPLPRFILVNLLAAAPKIAVLFGLGYFAARTFRLSHVIW